nr:MAG TPA: hypothetical protein [Caudoviricetes sp.]
MEYPVYGIPLTVESEGKRAPGADKYPGTNWNVLGCGGGVLKRGATLAV